VIPTTSFGPADPGLAEHLAARQELVEQRLREALDVPDVFIGATSQHLALAGGKRLRPLLTLLTAELGDADQPQVLDAAMVVELTHLASLYHDDVMDDAALRRGAPTAHAVWGNTVAILTGDLLFARASKAAAALGQEVLVLQADTFVRLCTGQLHETVGPQAGDDPIQHYLDVLSDKTASLIATAARFGAMLAGCTPDVVAFQLADDVLDLVSDGTVSGKTPGTDLREGVPTMPVLLLRARAAQPGASQADLDLVAMLDGDLSDDASLAAAVAALRAHDVVRETRALAAAEGRAAVAELDALPEGPVRSALVDFADALVDRTS